MNEKIIEHIVHFLTIIISGILVALIAILNFNAKRYFNSVFIFACFIFIMYQFIILIKKCLK
ncbi:hypothetical protein ADU81_14595 [Clostridium botulinum]|nr:hypothetical protein ADU81_14595 [Clostridium botulinum]